MKKGISLFLALIMSVMVFGACADEVELNRYEQLFVDALIKTTTADFYEPSAVRVLEIVSFDIGSIYDFKDETKEDHCPWVVTCRLQGENRVGGTLNHYYAICIRGGETQDKDGKEQLENIRGLVSVGSALGRDVSSWKERLIKMSAKVGDYCDLGDSEPIHYGTTSEFAIKNVNKALKAYWEDMGF